MLQPEIYPSWLLMLGWGSGLDSEVKVLQAICFLPQKELAVELSYVEYTVWTVKQCCFLTVHAYMYKHLFISFGIIGLKINNQTYTMWETEKKIMIGEDSKTSGL